MAEPLARLIHHLSRLPGIGEKSATRLALHVVRSSAEDVLALSAALAEVVERVRLCDRCMNLTEQAVCERCEDARRDHSRVCVVASPADLIAVDRGGAYRGGFHVLHGLLSPLDGVGPDDLRISELIRRLGSASAPAISEVIIATNPTVEGEATAVYLARILTPLGVRVTRIASGIPVGAELEYADPATISRALDGRIEMARS